MFVVIAFQGQRQKDHEFGLHTEFQARVCYNRKTPLKTRKQASKQNQNSTERERERKKEQKKGRQMLNEMLDLLYVTKSTSK